MIVSIDPSIRNLGWATKDGSNWDHGTIVLSKRGLPYQLEEIARRLNVDATLATQPNVFIVEYPEFFAGSEKGAIAAVDGTTFGLAAIAGYLQAYWRMPANKTFFYKPSIWKGQVPKQGMMYRFKKRFGYNASNDHEAEAALLLQYHLDQQ